ncbi:MAG: branched-chain amino acid transport system ATP-binding protein [Chloroflexota bacterium]|nr:branched-chain amino acid transport system ATP-binding protein [Chloroflexota bacterium]
MTGRAIKTVLVMLAVLVGDELVFGHNKIGPLFGLKFLLFPVGIPLGIILNGLVIGTLYSLIAFGLILVYRANRVLNFAQAGLGALPALVALILITKYHVPYVVAAVVVVVGCAGMGAFVEAFLMRRFADKPRLVATVATIGVAQFMILGEIYVPLWMTGSAFAPVSFPTPFQKFTFTITGFVFSGDYIAIVVVAVAMIAALGAFFRYTRVGIAMRASAENADRASLLGIPVARISTLVWVLACVCSGIAVFLRIPVLGLPIGVSVSPTLLLYALAAAIVARMESLPVALLAGMAIGVIDQSAYVFSSKPDLSIALMLPVILGGLLLRRNNLSRAMDTGISSFRTLQEFRPIPIEMRRLPEVRAARIGLPVLFVIFLVTAPYMIGTSRAGLMTLVVIYAIIGVSLVVLSGWTGQISLGHFAFAGIGAAVAGGLAANHHVDFFVALTAAGVVGAAFAFLMGLPALRIQGLFLSVVTLAFAATVQNVLLKPEYFPWLLPDSSSPVARPFLWARIDTRGDLTFYYVCLAFLALAYIAARNLRRSRSGRVFISTRDNVRAAQSYGISAAGARLAAFAFSGFVAAVAGGLFAYQLGSVEFRSFPLELSLDVFVFAVIGGLTSLSGAVMGAIVYMSLRFFLPLVEPLMPHPARDVMHFIDVIGIPTGVLFVLTFAPGGIAAALFGLRDILLRQVANRRGLEVPSLVADRRLSEPASDLDAVHAQQAHLPMKVAADALLVCEGVSVAYDSVQVLFGVDMQVRRGEIVALLGTNGAGKSTLLKAVSGLVHTSAGKVTFGGEEITGCTPARAARLGIVQVPGGRGIFPTLTVAEHFNLAAWLVKDPAQVETGREEILRRFPSLAGRYQQLAGNLSGGEQQQLALGMAFIARPEMLIVDELSLGLSPIVVEQLLELVRDINAQGTTVLLVEQSVNIALTVAGRAYFMEKGEVRFEGAATELLQRGDIIRSVFLEGAGRRASSTVVKPRSRKEAVADAEPVLVAEGLSKAFGGIRAVQDVSLRLAPREILGLIGPNGAGKTSVFDLVSGFTTPDRGRVLLDGVDVTSWSPDRRARAGLGRSFQDARIFPSMTVAENMAAALERHLLVRDHLGAGIGLPAVREQEEDIAWTVADLVELMSLQAFRDKFVRELSTGSRRVVDLAMAIAHDPAVLILDEPSSGIAQKETEALAPLLDRIRDETGCAMLVIEHDMPLVTGISDRLMALDLGQVIAEGLPRDVIHDPRVVSSYLGTDQRLVQRSGSRTARVRAVRVSAS